MVIRKNNTDNIFARHVHELPVSKPAVVIHKQRNLYLLPFVLLIATVLFVALLFNRTSQAAQILKLDPYALVENQTNRFAYSIVDTRDAASYKKGHIRGALMLTDKIDLKKQTVLLYGHTQFDQKSEEVARQMAAKGANVKILAIGWNEFRHFTNLWVPENAWNNFRIDDFIEEQ